MERNLVNGIPTEVYVLKQANGATQITNTPKIVIIPGNPGVISFYIPFIHYLHEFCNKSIDIYGVSHVGHDGIETGVYDLNEQIQHKIHFVQDLSKLHPESPIIIVGHSVGCYIGLKVQKQCPDLLIKNVVALFPTIKQLHQGLSPFVKVAILPVLRNSLSWLVHVCPKVVVEKILSTLSAMSDEARYITVGKVNRHLVHNVLYMAYTEGQQIVDIDEDCKFIIEGHQSNILLLYGRTDQYTPLSFYEEIKVMFPQAVIELAPENVAHAFVLKDSEVVAKRVSDFLNHFHEKSDLVVN
eukprot:TRINITY_DN2369_c0_g1_i4.p1 TRINITY_DN2369_c0_g1~~TRINITY_DN2369_c0_g1_i4.p1  ORF type:complete len:298 (-),score=42.88 TRINITY_DN2369_c0_g1_i4:44-937(-)